MAIKNKKGDDIKNLWAKQLSFTRNFICPELADDDQKTQHTKELFLHLISEVDECLRELNWKIHRKHEIDIIRKDRLLEEFIDLFKYVLSIIQTWGFTSEEFLNEFYRKSEVSEQRYQQEKQLSLITDENVVAVDVDGILGAYPEAFVSFIQKETKVNLKGFDLTNYNIYQLLADKIPGGIKKMKELKHKFRLAGFECDLPLIAGAKEGLDALKRKGYTIVLLTSRPYKQYPRFFADTISWCKKHRLRCDAILWDDNKEERIIKEFPKMKFMIEDVAANSNKIAEAGYKVYLFNKPYNINEKTSNGVVRVGGWQELIKLLGDEHGKKI